MKKICMALVMVGLAHFGAQAQSRFAKNYKVCKYSTGYAVCGHENAVNTPTPPQTTPTPLCLCDNGSTPIQMNKVNSYQGYYRKHNIIYSDDMNNPYEGLPSRQNDGPAKTWERNLNYLSPEALPGPDGNMPNE